MPFQLDVTVGIDLGDRHSHLCLIDTQSGEIIEESRIPTTQKGFQRRFSGCEPMRVAIEAGTHSPWISRALEGFGHEVLVANARKLRLIHAGANKNDRLDAENLARLARLDPSLLSPIEHRGEASQAHLALIRSHDVLVGTRTKLVHQELVSKGVDFELPPTQTPRGTQAMFRDPFGNALMLWEQAVARIRNVPAEGPALSLVEVSGGVRSS